MFETLIFIIILFAALCHAGWSSIVKSQNSLGIMGITSIIEILFFRIATSDFFSFNESTKLLIRLLNSFSEKGIFSIISVLLSSVIISSFSMDPDLPQATQHARLPPPLVLPLR